MLDIKWIREHAEEVQRAADQKGLAVSIQALLDGDDERRRLLQETERLRHERNAHSKRIAELTREGNAPERERLQAAVREGNRVLGELEAQLELVNARHRQLLLQVPNVPSADTPLGASDADNVEVRRVGRPPEFDFAPSDHVELGERLGLLDIPRGVKAGGSRSYYLRGAGAQLHRAVQQLAIDVLAERGFTLLEVPLMVREEALTSTGFFPLGREQTYELRDEDKWLVGTSEAPLVAYCSGEVLDLGAEPLRLSAATACFRREIGSAGRDVRGLYRVHQFAKVEQVVLCEADAAVSERMLQEITANAEHILELLELPYRVVAVCTGDMSQKTHKQYDIETWMPSRQAYGETHSASNLLDFQARRANIRYRDREGRLQYAHTLNNTAVATPRILIPLLENHQQADGTVYIPAALRPYMGGLERIR
ncbi:serine--tRNA ligase [Paenibacillus sp. HJGM_3]|uniref:serine--tRNA ligase n=1 Tax=Paenibacillus sp. HJGM_3 TaxID=3379816 RepID=UPI003859561D